MPSPTEPPSRLSGVAATDRPREAMTDRDRTIEGYTAEMRLHDAGGASALAEALAEIQELTATREAGAQ